MGLFSKIKKGLLKTKQQMVSKIELLLNSFTKIDEDLFEQLEETLIMSDVGVETSVEICNRLRKKIKEQGIKNPSEIMRLIHEIVADMMGDDTELDLSTKPSVIMVIGVNGAGKTTTIGKLCYKLKNEGKNVLVAAADTFRAAAIDQLEVWTERAGVNIVKHEEGSDAASVVFDGLSAAKARGCDVLIVDTAGRLHNKKNLMDELAKINRIINQQAEGCSREILLVLDATTGQNAVNQAKLFKEAADITGIVLTKLDGTAKGGIVISIKNELNIPVKLIGLGEKIDDLQSFNSADFVDALFGDDVLEHSAHQHEENEPEDNEEPEVTDNEESEVTDNEEPEVTGSEKSEVTDNEDNSAVQNEHTSEVPEDAASAEDLVLHLKETLIPGEVKTDVKTPEENEIPTVRENNAEPDSADEKPLPSEETQESSREDVPAESEYVKSASEDQTVTHETAVGDSVDAVSADTESQLSDENDQKQDGHGDEEETQTQDEEVDEEPKKKKSFFGNLFKKKKKK